jgi:hypothetical protein
MTSKTMKLSKKRKRVARTRAAIAWTRCQWIDEAQALLGEAVIISFTLKLAGRNGHRRLVRGLLMEFDRRLATGMIKLLCHPVQREFDRAAAFEEAITGMATMIESLRCYVEGRWVTGFGAGTTGIAQDDVDEFWRKARGSAELLRERVTASRRRAISPRQRSGGRAPMESAE